MLRIVIILLICTFAYYKSNWKGWRNYQSTILFLIAGSFMMHLITYNYLLWDQSSDLGGNLINDFVVTLFAYPPVVMACLTNYPFEKGIIKKCIYISYWVLTWTLTEGFLYLFGSYHYEHGWTLWKSMLLDYVLFPMLVIHYTRPLLAYVLFLIGTILFVIINGIPVSSFN